MREHCAMTSTVALGILLLEVHTALGCLSTPPEQRASEGSDVSLTCDFSKCPGPLDHRMLSVEWEFQGSASSDESKPIIYHIQNNTVATVPGVVFKGNVALGDFSISLRSVTMKDNGTYTCRLRAALENNIYKNHTYLVITPGMVKHEGGRITLLHLASKFPKIACICSLASLILFPVMCSYISLRSSKLWHILKDMINAIRERSTEILC